MSSWPRKRSRMESVSSVGGSETEPSGLRVFRGCLLAYGQLQDQLNQEAGQRPVAGVILHDPRLPRPSLARRRHEIAPELPCFQRALD
jgi:hypothetical protein